MKKYYVAAAVLIALCVGAIIYTAGQGSDAKIDKATNAAVEEFANKFNSYSYNVPGLPASLSAAGIHDAPSTVSNQKLSDSKYKVCFDYRQAAGGFDAGWTALVSGPLLAGGGSSSSASYLGKGYFDSSVEFNHKKGPNCQTIQITLYNYGDSCQYFSYTCDLQNGSPESAAPNVDVSNPITVQ